MFEIPMQFEKSDHHCFGEYIISPQACNRWEDERLTQATLAVCTERRGFILPNKLYLSQRKFKLNSVWKKNVYDLNEEEKEEETMYFRGLIQTRGVVTSGCGKLDSGKDGGMCVGRGDKMRNVERKHKPTKIS